MITLDPWVEITGVVQSWQEIDISSIVPVNTVIAVIRVVNDTGTVGDVEFRHPSTDTVDLQSDIGNGATEQGQWKNQEYYAPVYNQTIEISTDLESKSGGVGDFEYYVVAYITSAHGGILAERVDVTPTDPGQPADHPLMANSYTDIDLSSVVPVNTTFAIVEITSFGGGAGGWNTRAKGTTMAGSNSSDGPSHVHELVPLNDDRVFEFWGAAVDRSYWTAARMDLHVIGYITVGEIATDQTAEYWNTDTGDGTYKTKTVTSAPDAVVLKCDYHTGHYFAIRPEGQSDELYGGGVVSFVNSTYLVPLNSSGQFEMKFAYHGMEVYAIGYLSAESVIEESAVAAVEVIVWNDNQVIEEAAVAAVEADHGNTFEEIVSESITSGDTLSQGIEQERTALEEIVAVVTVVSEWTGSGKGSCEYGYYSAISYGHTNLEGTASMSYPRYTIVSTADNPIPATTLKLYPKYTATGEGTTTLGNGQTVDYETFNEYECTGTGANGYLGTASLEYGSYTVVSATPGIGVGSCEYPEYDAEATTPGSASDTDFAATSASVYPTYTISVVTGSNFQGQSSSSFTVYTAYNASGTGIHDEAGVGSAAYTGYQAIATGISGDYGTATVEYPEVATAYGPRTVEIASYTIVATGYNSAITGTSTSTYPKMYANGAGVAKVLEVVTGRLVTGDGEAFVTGDGKFIIVGQAKTAEYEVMTMSMNLTKRAVTEYHNYGFNSIGKSNEIMYGSSSDGIYILGDSSDDDGTGIVSNVEKLETDYDTGMRKRATDAYLYLETDGSYEFASVADGTRSGQTIADTDTVMHTRKVDLAKGLIGRGLGFAFKTDGVAFELEEIELVVDVGSRRSKKYA